MNLISACFLFLLQLNLILSLPPSIFGGSCVQVHNQVYYIGGKVPNSPSNNSDIRYSTDVYKLDLTIDLKLDEKGEANWQVVNSNSPNLHFSSIVAEGEKSDRIFSFGGLGTPASEAFQIYDISTSSWTIPSTINENYPPVILSNKQTANNTFYYSTFLKSSSSEFIHYGGVLKRNNNVGLEGRSSIGIFNPNKGTWSWPRNGGVRVYSHVACIYKNMMYVVTGYNFDTQDLLPTNIVMAYDITRAKWTNLTANGDVPEKRVGASATLIDNKLYLIGGASDFQFTGYPGNQIYILDLDTTTWSSKTVDSFKPTYAGCLFSYDNHLVYSFGTHGGYSSTTQLVNLSNFTLVNQIQAKSKSNDDDSTSDNDQSTKDLAAIIGGSVAGVLVLITLLLYFIYYWSKANKEKERQRIEKEEQEASRPPKPLHQDIWVENLGLQTDANLTFDLSATTQGPNFDSTMSKTGYSNSTKVESINNSTKP